MAYIGPGDLQAFAAWWALRAFSAATAGTSCIDLAQTPGGTPTTINTLSNGNIDVATALAFLSPATFGYCSKIYDKTGGGHDLVQVVGSSQPIIQFGALQSGTLPEIQMPAVAFITTFSMADAGTFTVTNPWSMVAVVKPISFSGQRTILGDGTAGSGAQGFIYNSATQAAFWYASFTGSAFNWSIGSYHRLIGVNNGASSLYALDGSVSTFTGDATGWQTTGVAIGDSIGDYNANAVEFGIAAAGFSSGDATAMDSNINNYWFAAAPPAGINIWPYSH